MRLSNTAKARIKKAAAAGRLYCRTQFGKKIVDHINLATGEVTLTFHYTSGVVVRTLKPFHSQLEY